MLDVPCKLITSSGLWRPTAEACCFVRPLFLFLIGSCTWVGRGVSLERLFKNGLCPEVAYKTHALLKHAPVLVLRTPFTQSSSASSSSSCTAPTRAERRAWKHSPSVQSSETWCMTVEVDERGAVAGQNIKYPSQVHIVTEVQMFLFSSRMFRSSSVGWFILVA